MCGCTGGIIDYRGRERRCVVWVYRWYIIGDRGRECMTVCCVGVQVVLETIEEVSDGELCGCTGGIIDYSGDE